MSISETARVLLPREARVVGDPTVRGEEADPVEIILLEAFEGDFSFAAWKLSFRNPIFLLLIFGETSHDKPIDPMGRFLQNDFPAECPFD